METKGFNFMVTLSFIKVQQIYFGFFKIVFVVSENDFSGFPVSLQFYFDDNCLLCCLE